MVRTSFALAVCAVIGVGAITWAQHEEHGAAKRKLISRKDIAEKLDGKQCQASTVEVSLEPGVGSAPHRHPGPVFGYVLEGTYEWAIDDNPGRILKAGDTFYEPTGTLHRVSRNPAKTGRTRVLAVLLHPHDAREIVIPEKGASKR